MMVMFMMVGILTGKKLGSMLYATLLAWSMPREVFRTNGVRTLIWKYEVMGTS